MCLQGAGEPSIPRCELRADRSLAISAEIRLSPPDVKVPGPESWDRGSGCFTERVTQGGGRGRVGSLTLSPASDPSHNPVECTHSARSLARSTFTPDSQPLGSRTPTALASPRDGAPRDSQETEATGGGSPGCGALLPPSHLCHPHGDTRSLVRVESGRGPGRCGGHTGHLLDWVRSVCPGPWEALPTRASPPWLWGVRPLTGSRLGNCPPFSLLHERASRARRALSRAHVGLRFLPLLP